MYDPDYTVKAYTERFETMYGEILPTQTWDFSTGTSIVNTRAEETIDLMSIAGLDFKITRKTSSILNPKYDITQNAGLYDNVIKALPENTKHTGETVVLTAPSNSFMIYPVSVQGAYTYDLIVKVGDKTHKIFSKTWSDYSLPYINGDGKLSTTKVKTKPMPGVKITAPVGTPIQIYLDNLKNGKNLVTDKLIGTGTGNAIFVNATAKPEGLGNVLDVDVNDAIVKYIGIEDSPNFGDQDFNDIVLALVGNPYVPQELIVTEEEYKLPIAKPAKRYMIEDLGSIDDFDFNDIVIDVMDIVEGKYKATFTNGVLTSNELVETTHYQTATVKHLGGTLPFILKIGDTVLDEIRPAINIDPDYEYVITGWDPKLNNIQCIVNGQENNSITIGFPEPGSVPMIIAFDTYKQWMEERVAVPKEWFK